MRFRGGQTALTCTLGKYLCKRGAALRPAFDVGDAHDQQPAAADGIFSRAGIGVRDRDITRIFPPAHCLALECLAA